MSALCTHATLAAANGGACPICDAQRAAGKSKAKPGRPPPTSPVASRPPGPGSLGARPPIDPALARKRLAELRAVNCRERLADFVRHGWHVLHPGVTLAWNWHLDAICDHVQALIAELFRARRNPKHEQSTQNAVINIPPRQLKTEILQIFLPAWVWIEDPSISVRCVSGNSRVVNLASQDCRALLGSQWYRDWFKPQWEITDDADAVKLFKNTARGRRHASTTLEKITGEGTDIIVVDDPHDAGDVASDVKRASVIEKWDKAISNRVNDTLRCARIGIMQRLHEEDWSGHVLAQGGWEHLNLPMEFERKRGCRCPSCAAGKTWIGWSDPRTEEGELLHPERWPKAKVEEARTVLGAYGFAGQMQQRPAPADGGMFKRAWFKEFDLGALPRFDDVLVSCDLANSEHAVRKGSNNALLVLGRKGSWRYILDAQIGRWSMTEIQRRITELQATWQKRAGIPTVKVLVEKKAAGNFVISALRTEMHVMGVVEDDEAQKAHNDKIVRANAVVAQVEGGNVMVPKGAPWVEEFLHELCTFPNGAHDDQVDAFTMALNYWRGSVDLARAMMMAKW